MCIYNMDSNSTILLVVLSNCNYLLNKKVSLLTTYIGALSQRHAYLECIKLTITCFV